MSDVVGWMVGSGTLNEVAFKTAALITRGIGWHPLYWALDGFTALGTVDTHGRTHLVIASDASPQHKRAVPEQVQHARLRQEEDRHGSF